MNDLVGDLTEVVGNGNVLQQPQLDSRNPGYCSNSLAAGILVKPASTAEVAAIVVYAGKHGIPLVPQGGLTGLVDGTASQEGSIIVSFERMNRVIRVDPVQSVLVAESGVRLQDAHDAAEKHGLMLGVDIPSRGSCTIGGIVSTNAGGIRVIRYGMTRENLLGLTVVLADGSVIDANNTLMKNNAGFDLKQLFVGSEGTLGLVTEAVFKLHPKPVLEHTALLAAESVDQVLALLQLSRQRLGASLLSFEVMWEDYYRTTTASPNFGPRPIEESWPLYVIIETGVWNDGRATGSETGSATGSSDSAMQALLESALESGLITDGVVASSEAERRKIWQSREDGDAVGHGFDSQHSYDVGFELRDIEPFVTSLRAEMRARWPEKTVYVFGHLGDGNLHIILCYDKSEEDIVARYDQVVYEVVGRFANSTVSAEHGIGTRKLPWLQQSRSAPQLALMKKLLTTMDPDNLLNPGKVLESCDDSRQPGLAE